MARARRRVTHRHSAKEHVIAALSTLVRASVYVAFGLNRFSCVRRGPGQQSATNGKVSATHCGVAGGGYMRETAGALFAGAQDTAAQGAPAEAHLLRRLQGQATLLQPEPAFSLHEALALDGCRTGAQARHHFNRNAQSLPRHATPQGQSCAHALPAPTPPSTRTVLRAGA
jgi:hypothetical protein